MSMTTALGQKKRGKDALPPLEPEFTSSPVFPPKKPPPLQTAVQRPNQQSWVLVDAAQGRGGGQGHVSGKFQGI